MRFPRFRRHSLKTAVFCFFSWLTLHGAVLVQAADKTAKKGDASTTGGGAYVMAYGLVILATALGMLFVCRSSNRRDRAKPEVYGQAKTAEKKD